MQEHSFSQQNLNSGRNPFWKFGLSERVRSGNDPFMVILFTAMS